MAKTYEDSTGKIFKTQAEAAASNTALGTNPKTNNISSANLAQTTPVNVTTPPISSNVVGYNAELTAQNNSELDNQTQDDALVRQTNKETADREAKLATSTKTLEDYLGGRKGETELTDEAYSQKNELGTTVDETSKTLRNISNKINAVDIRANEQIKQLEKNTQGLFGGALQQEINKVQRQAFSDKADLYIEKMMAQGDFDSAKSIADRQVAVKLEQDKQTLDTLQFQYENNKDLFTKSEQRQFELAQDDRKRRLDAKEADLKTISDLSLDALQNGAPPMIASQMRNAKTVDEAMRIGGSFVGALTRNKSTGGGGSGRVLSSLPVSIQGKVIAAAEKFSGSDIVKKFNATTDSINVVNGIQANSKNPADHQAIVYSFAKALDPDSAVKEGEYDTIKKYAQSAVSRYGKEIENALNGTGFLSEKAITDIKTTMNNLYTSRKPQYDNAYSERARIINNIAGADVAGELLTDYSGGANLPSDNEVGNQDPNDVFDSVINQETPESSSWIVNAWNNLFK